MHVLYCVTTCKTLFVIKEEYYSKLFRTEIPKYTK